MKTMNEFIVRCARTGTRVDMRPTPGSGSSVRIIMRRHLSDGRILQATRYVSVQMSELANVDTSMIDLERDLDNMDGRQGDVRCDDAIA